MKQEDKDLLLKDLCGRLPYGVKVLTYKLDYFHNPSSIETLYEINEDGYISTVESDTLRPIGKPYLFPLSSMTEEQKENLNKAIQEDAKEAIEAIRNNDKMFHAPWRAIDWLNANHFDYRGLIPMGLANDATNKGIY